MLTVPFGATEDIQYDATRLAERVAATGLQQRLTEFYRCPDAWEASVAAAEAGGRYRDGDMSASAVACLELSR